MSELYSLTPRHPSAGESDKNMNFDLNKSDSYPLFDTHAHYNDSRFDKGQEIEGGREEILPVLFSTSVKYIVNNGTNLKTNAESIRLAEKYSGMYAAVGIHPEDINESDNIDEVMEKLKVQLSHPKVKAFGEIGLDYHWDTIPREVQKKWFRAQLELAREVKMPVVIHDREAHGDVMDILHEYRDVVGELHSFSGSAEMARQLTDRGWYISFSGVITFKNASRLAEIVPTVPLDRIMIETDCPYLAPVPYRGKINHSGLMSFTAQRAAELYGIPVYEFKKHAFENAVRFFGTEDKTTENQ